MNLRVYNSAMVQYMVVRDNSKEVFINENIIVFTPIILKLLKRVESKQLGIQHQVILLIVKIDEDFISIHELL